MSIIIIMIPISLFMLAIGVVAFFWATNNGQFDDMQSPGLTPVSDNLPDEDDPALNKEDRPNDKH